MSKSFHGVNRTILHYKILQELGRGGMGVVYKAHDTELERDVAIKFLPAHIANDADERERFRIEAKAAAALNHANIATIHAIEKSDDETFIVMEFVDGHELKEKIDAGPLPVEEVLDIALQMVKGLKAAHEKDVVHRDIKSANIMITRTGDVKIMDFGLAKMGGQSKLTKEGTTLGTIAYMSPEQTRGDEVDHRSDIFSAGVLIYEMITGQLPFKGEYDQAVTYSILNEEPKPITSLRSRIPLELERIVNKCLAKQPAERYQHTDDLLVDLGSLQKQLDLAASNKTTSGPMSAQHETKKRSYIGSIAAITLIAAAVLIGGYFLFYQKPSGEDADIKMIAVLPFENLGQAEDQYFTDGITEEITNRLTSVAGLGVISHTSAMHYKKTDKTTKQIGSELGINYILGGSVRWAKDSNGITRLKVSPRLVRVEDDRQLWSSSYDRKIDDIFELQSGIAVQVMNELEVTLAEPQRQDLNIRPTDDIEAYKYFLRGHDLSDSWENASLLEAVKMYEQAVALDPSFAIAYAELARANASLYHFYDRTAEREAQTRIAALKSLELAPDDYQSHLALGYYHYHVHKNYEEAMKEFNIAGRMRQNDPEVLYALALIQRRRGQWQETVINNQKAIRLNPRDAGLLLNLGDSFYTLRRYDEAHNYLDQCLALRPDFIFAMGYKALAYWHKNWDLAAARKALAPIQESDDPIASHICFLQLVYEGNYEQAIRRIGRSRDEVIPMGYTVRTKDLLSGWCNLLAGNNEVGRQQIEKARRFLAKAVLEKRDGDYYLTALGIANALLGHEDEAIAAGQRAVAAHPISQDAAWGPNVLLDLAWINTLVGQSDKAIEQLDILLSIPSELSTKALAFDPAWASLRDQPGFVELLRKYDPVR